MPIVYSGEGDYRKDADLAGLRLRGLSKRERASERAWSLYAALHVRFERELRGIRLGVLPDGIWVAIRPANVETSEYLFAVERKRLDQGYRVGIAVGFSATEREKVDALRDLMPYYFPERRWTQVIAAAEKSDAQAKKAASRRKSRWRREAREAPPPRESALRRDNP